MDNHSRAFKTVIYNFIVQYYIFQKRREYEGIEQLKQNDKKRKISRLPSEKMITSMVNFKKK